jgi:hypothetical protein
MKRFWDEEEDRVIQEVVALHIHQTEEERAAMRAEFESRWPELAAYIKHTLAREGERLDSNVMEALASSGRPPIPTRQQFIWYVLDRTKGW